MTTEEVMAATAIYNWKMVLGRLNGMLGKLSDEDLQKHVAPGRNRVFYLVGHLAAVHDKMFPLLRIGERLYPELEDAFMTQPDGKAADGFSAAEVRAALADVNARLTAAMEALTPAQWLERHASITEDDFRNEPLRNRMSVLLSRTGHVAFHAGQVRLTLAT